MTLEFSFQYIVIAVVLAFGSDVLTVYAFANILLLNSPADLNSVMTLKFVNYLLADVVYLSLLLIISGIVVLRLV